MRLVSFAVLAIAILVPAGLGADVVVLVDGRVFEVDGPIVFDGDFVHFKMPKTGQEVHFRRFEVDENKTRGLNQVLDSDLHGWPRLKKVQSIEGQRARTTGRSKPIVAERPLPPTRAEQYQEMKAQRKAEQEEEMRKAEAEAEAERERELAEERRRQAEEEARLAEERAAEEAARRKREAERKAEEEARLERERERQAARAAAEEERQKTLQMRQAQDRDARTASYRDRIIVLEGQIRESQQDLRRLTDLQTDAQKEFEGRSLESVEREIDATMRRIERLEARKASLEERLKQLEAE